VRPFSPTPPPGARPAPEGGFPEVKAVSVDAQGRPDGFRPDRFFRPEVLQGGISRLVVSVDGAELPRVHRALVAALSPPLKLLYVQMVDRPRGVQLPKPVRRVAVELSRSRVMELLEHFSTLFYVDGRHQLWLRGSAGEQLVLDELGMIYLYPDDFLFRDVLEAEGVPEGDGACMARRDYVRVVFDAAQDDAERSLIAGVPLLEWNG